MDEAHSACKVASVCMTRIVADMAGRSWGSLNLYVRRYLRIRDFVVAEELHDVRDKRFVRSFHDDDNLHVKNPFV